MKPAPSLVLALEASTLRPTLWLAPLDAPDRPVWEWSAPPPSSQRGPGIIEALAALPAHWHPALRLIAVGIGPGRYSGIRACVTAALAWRLARGTALVGILSPDAIAAHYPAAPSLAVIGDARRAQIWAAHYEGGHRTRGPALLPLSALDTLARSHPALFIPEEGLPCGTLAPPHAREIALLGVSRWLTSGGDPLLEPVHLQPPVMPPPPKTSGADGLTPAPTTPAAPSPSS